jgi:hypothetical protein
MVPDLLLNPRIMSREISTRLRTSIQTYERARLENVHFLGVRRGRSRKVQCLKCYKVNMPETKADGEKVYLQREPQSLILGLAAEELIRLS